MDYQTVFDIAVAGYKSWYVAVTGLLFVAVGAGLIAFHKKFPGCWVNHPVASILFGFTFFGITVYSAATRFVSMYGQYSELTRAANSDRARVVEGIVTNFKPIPFSGHAMERFCV